MKVLVGTFTVSQSNFLGTGNTVSSSVSTGEVNKTYALSYQDPYWTDDGVSEEHLELTEKMLIPQIYQQLHITHFHMEQI